MMNPIDLCLYLEIKMKILNFNRCPDCPASEQWHVSLTKLWCKVKEDYVLLDMSECVFDEPEVKKCAVQGCTNYSNQGQFKGSFCMPCYTFLTTLKGQSSQAYRNYSLRNSLLLQVDSLEKNVDEITEILLKEK